MLGADAQQDRGPNQARWDGIDVAGHGDRRKPGDDDPQLLARSKRGGRQWAQGHFFCGEASCSGLVAFVNEILDKMVVGRSAGEVPTAAHPQRLIDRLFEAVMGLLHIAVFMCDSGIVPGGLHAVMRHERLVACCPVFSLFLAQ